MQKDYLESFACTNVGHVRKNNEDAALMLIEQRIFVVADGMGGGMDGELASRMAISEIEKNALDARIRPAELESAIIRSAYAVNQEIRNYALEHEYKAMGTTVACLFFNPWRPAEALALHAGDSRIYRFRRKKAISGLFNKKLELLTTDHSKTPGSNVLTNVVGLGAGFYLERTVVDVQSNDMFIVCSDGLSHMLSDREINSICTANTEIKLKEVCMNLVNRALEKGGKDNITIIVVRVNDLPDPYLPSETEQDEESTILIQNIHMLSRTSN